MVMLAKFKLKIADSEEIPVPGVTLIIQIANIWQNCTD